MKRRTFEGGQHYAHRLAFEVFNGPLQRGLCVCHQCDNPKCVNPAHLFAGTKRDNTQDMLRKGRNRNVPHIGSANGFSRLNEAAVLEIRKLRAGGMTTQAIATRFGISQSLGYPNHQSITW